MIEIPGTPELWSQWLRTCQDGVDRYREQHSAAGLELDDIYHGFWRAHEETAAKDPKAAAVLLTCLMHIAAGYTES